MSDPIAALIGQLRQLERRLAVAESLSSRAAQWGVASWVPDPTIGIDGYGRKITAATTDTPGWTAIMWAPHAHGVGGVLGVAIGTTATLTLKATVLASDRPGRSPAATQTVWTATATGTAQAIDFTLPTSLWTPTDNPAGSLIRLDLVARVASSSGSATWAPTTPIRFGPS